MIFSQVNNQKTWQEFEKLKTWDDWYIFEKKYFNPSQWPTSNIQQLEKNLNRKEIIIGDTTWEPTHIGCDIDINIYILHEKLSNLIFAKLEPEAFAENEKTPERYGKVCYHCVYWTRNHKKKFCDFCNRELFYFPLNE